MWKAKIKTGVDYAIREKRGVGNPVQRVRILKHTVAATAATASLFHSERRRCICLECGHEPKLSPAPLANQPKSTRHDFPLRPNRHED